MTPPKKLVEINEVLHIITYPKNVAEIGVARSKKLTELGIKGIYDYGPLFVEGLRVLGKGHSSIVLLAKHESIGDVAVKIRRTDSKKDSLSREGYLMTLDRFGVTPKVHYFDDDLIIMEFIDGVTLGKYLGTNDVKDATLLKLIRNVLTSAYKLDLNLIDHLELANPYKHIFILKDMEVKIIDFESAKVSENPCNLCRIVSYLTNLLRISKQSNIEVMLKKYKSGCRDSFQDILTSLTSLIAQLNGISV